jgi:hypothetical protein
MKEELNNESNKMSINKRDLIAKHLEGWHGLVKASIESYYATGKVSGSLLLNVEKMMDEYAQSLQKQIEEMEDKLHMSQIRNEGMKDAVDIMKSQLSQKDEMIKRNAIEFGRWLIVNNNPFKTIPELYTQYQNSKK